MSCYLLVTEQIFHNMLRLSSVFEIQTSDLFVYVFVVSFDFYMEFN